MAKINTKDKITSIEEQIKKLKEKQKRILAKTQTEIGKYLMETWGVEDLNEAKILIDTLKNQVTTLNEVSSTKEKDERSNSPEK